MLSLGRPVGRCAVKLVCPRPLHPADTTAADMREESKLAHPHLLALQQVGVMQSGPAAGWIYIVTELGEQSLQELLDRQETLKPEQARLMVEQVCQGLAYLHEHNLAHGEVRPTNIIQTAKGWKLSGLEYRGRLARRLEEFGSTDYLFIFRAPETFQGPLDTPEADMWSLGMVTHAALTGRLPFAETADLTKGDMLWKISNQDPEPEPQNPMFDTLFAGVLRRNPHERWSAEQALTCLQGGVVREVLKPPPPPPPPPPEEESDSSPAAPPSSTLANWAFLGVAMAVVAVGIVIGVQMTPRSQRMVPNIPSARLSTVPFDVATLDSRGRLGSLPAEAPVFREDLGSGQSLELIQIPLGEFDMGSPVGEPMRETDESPRHRVRLDPFYMSRTEITQAQWAAVAALPPVSLQLPPNPSKYVGDALPVQGMTWNEAEEFCRRLSQATGRLYRLPTESEWEYACRGGPSDTPFAYGPALTDQVANFKASSSYPESLPPGQDRGMPTAVHSFPGATPFGLYDMHGNVAEWCLDFYGTYPDSRRKNPQGPREGRERVVRGGSFQDYPWTCRSASRSHAAPDAHPVDVGLRVVAPEMVPER